MAQKELKLRITGDAGPLQSEFQKAGRATTELGSNFERLARSQGVELSSTLQRNVEQLRALRDRLVQIGAPASDVEKVTRKLADAQKEYDKALNASSTSTGKFSGFLQQHGAAIGATLATIGSAAFLFGKQSVGAFEESEIALAQLNNVIESTGGVAGVTAEEVLEMSAAIQKSTGISDEAATTAQSMLLSFTKIGKEVFPEVTHAVADMATFMNKGAVPSMEQMTQTAQQIGKAMQDPVEGVSALQRVGVRLSESQKDLVKDLMATGRTADAQRVILKELQTEFGGAAEAAGKTFRGQVKIAREELNDFQEDVGSKIVPTLQSLMQDFPGTAKGVLFLTDTIGGLNIRAGDLLIGLPLLKQAFGGLGLPSIASGFGGVSSAIGLINPVTLAAAAGLGAFLYAYHKISEERAVNDQLRESIDLMQKFIDVGKSAGLSTESLRTLKVAAGEAAAKLGETRTEAQIFADLVKKAAAEGVKPMTGEIRLWATAQDNVKKALDYTRPSLTAEIKELEREIATMKAGGKEKELVWKAEDRLAEMKKKLTGQTKELVSALEKEQKAALGKIPALESEIKLSAKYIAGLEKEVKLHPENTRLVGLLAAAKAKQLENIKELNSVLDQEIILTDKYGKVTKTTTLEVYRFIEATKDLDKVMLSTEGTLESAMKTSADLGALFRTQLPADFGKPKTALLDLESAFKTLGVTSDATFRSQAAEARAAFEAIKNSGTATPREIEAAWKAMGEKLKSDKNANLTNWRELASKQVSTVVTDFGKGFTDILFSAGSFGGKLIGLFSQIGQSISRAWIESGVMGILSGKGFAGFSGFGQGLFDAFKGTGTAKTGFNLAAFAPGAAKLFGFGTAAGTTALSAAGSLALGSTVLTPGVAAALPTTFVNTGLMTPGIAGAGSGFPALGALLTNPWTIGIAGAAIGGTLLYKRLSRRGKEKKEATGAAEDLRDTVWQDIVPSVESGQVSVDEGIAQVKSAWAAYESWLRTNLKDQTVINRSIESQRITLTDSLAALEKLRVSRELDSLLQKFDKTGEITEELSAFVAKLNGNLSAFKNAARIPELQRLRSGFAGLKDELLKLKPPAEDMILKFLKTGEITPQLKAKITEFGGSLAAFESFSRIRSIRDNFESLRSSFTGTKEEIDRLRPAFIEFGGDMAALDAASALPGLRSLKGAFAELQSGIASLLPPTKSWQQIFLETGVITQEMRDAIAAAGAELKPFEDFAQAKTLQRTFEDIQKGFSPTNTQPLRDFVALLTQLKIGGHDFKGSFISDINTNINFADEAAVTALMAQINTALNANQTNALISLNTAVTNLQTNLDTTIANLQTAIETALDTVGTKLDIAIGDASDALITQLGILDTNLDTAIGDLQTALAAEITNLTTAISNLKIPDSITLKPEQSAPPAPPEPQNDYPYPGYPGGYPGSGYPYYGGAYAEGGEGIVRKPTWFLAGEAGPEAFRFEPLRTLIDPRLAEQVISPFTMAQIRQSFSGTEARREPAVTSVDSRVDNSRVVHMPITIQAPLPDPFAFEKQMNLIRSKMISDLS